MTDVLLEASLRLQCPRSTQGFRFGRESYHEEQVYEDLILGYVQSIGTVSVLLEENDEIFKHPHDLFHYGDPFHRLGFAYPEAARLSCEDVALEARSHELSLPHRCASIQILSPCANGKPQ